MSLATILKDMNILTEQKPDDGYEHLFMKKSVKFAICDESGKPVLDKDGNETYEYNDFDTSVDAMISDESNDRDVFYNVFVKATDDGKADLDSFIQNELIPNGCHILTKTQKLSKKKTWVRYMCARPLTS